MQICECNIINIDKRYNSHAYNYSLYLFVMQFLKRQKLVLDSFTD